MKTTTKIISTVMLLLLLTGTVTYAQDNIREDKKEKRSFVQSLDKVRLLTTSQFQAMKSATDNDIDTWLEEYWDGEEWLEESRATFSYNTARTEITVSYEYYSESEWVEGGTETLTMDSNGYPMHIEYSYSDETFEEVFHYSEPGKLDSVTYTEFYDDSTYTGKTELVYVTEDSIRLVEYYMDEGEMVSIDYGYFVNRDGNFIEAYDEESEGYIDRYTYYNTSFSDFLKNIYNEFFFVESYNDEYYFDTEEWEPYSRTTLTEADGVVTEILEEYYYEDEGWFEEYKTILTYTDGEITQVLDQYNFSSDTPDWEDDYRTSYTYGGVVSNEDVQMAQGFELYQNYPNPFNPTTQIVYSIPSAANVSLEVYNVLGNKVATLAQERKAAGQHVSTFDASNLPSGVYYYKLQFQGVSQVRSMMLIK